MNPTKIIGIILIVAGGLGLAYGGFSYTKQTTGVKLGPIELKVQERETISVPLIISAGAIALGVFLLVAVGRKLRATTPRGSGARSIRVIASPLPRTHN